ncbi:hypothetical protein [Kitasatospora sp. NPDC001175]|uniref:hypothetical protein n=1 Tax=Kitasatospora sp. NPDC001175 TaxID=3157103 RepID=UPI003D002665
MAGTLAVIGTPAKDRNALAEALLDHPFWDGEMWYSEGAGSPLSDASSPAHASRALLCGGSYSPRSIRFGLSPDQDARLAEALGTAD